VSYRLEFAVLPDEAATARTRYEQCDDEECEHVPSCDDAYFELVAPHQMHLTIVEMARALSGMRRFALVHEATPIEFEGPFYNWEEWQALGADERAEYSRRERIHQSQTVAGATGIANFKLESNGPWIVTVSEIRGALDAYRLVPDEARADAEADEQWVCWIDWLRRSARNGGFIVN